MKTRFIVALLLVLATLMTAAILFSGRSANVPVKHSTPPPTIDIKWGEGSEAGTPDGAQRHTQATD